MTIYTVEEEQIKAKVNFGINWINKMEASSPWLDPTVKANKFPKESLCSVKELGNNKHEVKALVQHMERMVLPWAIWWATPINQVRVWTVSAPANWTCYIRAGRVTKRHSNQQHQYPKLPTSFNELIEYYKIKEEILPLSRRHNHFNINKLPSCRAIKPINTIKKDRYQINWTLAAKIQRSNCPHLQL